ncbi:uncharacterized protein LOC141696230 [Apium graveolens]|uniref:uncharacterized protein LOC141696230 n=1 Tax=Apium graveolens TaxID=4045 RepID=UPI003D79ADE8
MGGKVDHSVNYGRAAYVYRLNGQNHHVFGSLIPDEGDDPKFCQLYIYDTKHEVDNRMKWVKVDDGEPIDTEINVEGLVQMLDESNQLVKIFCYARDRFKEQPVRDFKIKLKICRAQNGRENLIGPSDEVACVMVGDIDTTVDDKDLIVEKKINDNLKYIIMQKCGKPLERISSIHPSLMALQYPLLFPLGEDGYHNEIPSSCSLSRSSLPAVVSGTTDASNVGKGYVFPANFLGSRRYMQQNFQDALAICCAVGHPDIFLTMTTNPLWDEIFQMMKIMPGCSARDSPEFQKHGFPHVHMLIWLDFESKKKLSSNVDTFVSVDIPDPITDPVSYEAVKSLMIHGPCGLQNTKSPCMNNCRCTKHFPKKYCRETYFDQSGFLIYRRYNTGITVSKGKIVHDNQWVVPYKRDLLVKYQFDKQAPIDEINAYFDGRYIYASEAAYRIFGFPIHSRQLEAFFFLNQKDPSARKYTFDEIPEHYVWNDTDKIWTMRKRGKQIGRMLYTHHSDGEIWYLRLLLSNACGATSFDSLKTVNGVRYTTFKDACKSLGLLGDDNEWHSLLKECSVGGFLEQIRQLFLHIIINCEVFDLKILWQQHWKFIHESDITEFIKHTSLLIWDEAPMQHRYAFDSLDRSHKDIMKAVDPTRYSMPFGGITVVLGSEFRKILPIIPISTRGDIVSAYITRSRLWVQAKIMLLYRNMRLNQAQNETEVKMLNVFAEWILNIGNGHIKFLKGDGNVYEEDDIILSAHFCDPKIQNSVKNMIDWTYPDCLSNYKLPK